MSNPLDSLIGQPYEWSTIGGAHYKGVVVDTDSNVLIVLCDDGVKRAVEAE